MRKIIQNSLTWLNKLFIFAASETNKFKNMYNMKKLFMAFIATATLCVGSAYAQPAAVKKIIETAKTDNQTMHHMLLK